MSKCIQCGAQNPEKQGSRGRARKYCSKKCAQKFYTEQGRYNKHKKPGSDWGTLTAKRKQKVENRKKQFEWYKDNWYTASQIAEKLNIEPSTVHARSKIMGVLPKIVGGGSSPTAFWNPEDIERLKYKETPIPEGYITRKEVCQLLNIKKNTFVTGGYHKKIKPDMLWQQTHGMRNTQHLYLKSKIEKYAKDKEAAEKARKLEIKEREQERIKRVAAAKAERLEARARKEAAREEARIKRQQLLAEQKAATYERRLAKQRALYPKATEDWQSVAVRERRLFKRFPLLLERHANNDKEFNAHSRAIKLNKKYSRLAKAGILTELTCRTCGVTQPYYDFYYDRSDANGRRTSRCRKCESARSKQRYALTKESRKQRRKENYRSKFRVLIAAQIKKDISRARQEYASGLSVGDIWSNIKEYCGYDLEDFILHMEKQFNENMHWLNHGRGSDQYYWQIDHIIPRSKFHFTEFDDPAFAKCWSLDNMQPLSQYENMTKDNPLIPVQKSLKKKI